MKALEGKRRRSPFMFSETPTLGEHFDACRERAMELRPPATYQQPPVLAVWHCANRYCGWWTAGLEYDRTLCHSCKTPRPATE